MRPTTWRLVAAVLLAAVGVTGCQINPFTAPESLDNGLALVVASTSNERHLTEQQWAAAIDGRIGDGTRLTVVSTSGEPELVGSWNLQTSGNSIDARAEIAAFAEGGAAVAASTLATEPEADPFGAIALAARSIAGMSSCTILVSGSMLSTSTPIDLQRLGIGVDSTDLVAELTEARALPDLAGCAVRLLALGEVAGTQDVLDERNRAMVELLVVDVLTAAGAEVEIAPVVRGAEPAPGLPPVTPIEVEPFAVPRSEPGPAQAACTVEIPDASIGFVADEATYADAERSAEVFGTLAAAFEGCDLTSVTVYATTSSAGTAGARLDLSERRGATVADSVAAALGIDRGSIEVVGLGNCEIASSVTCVDDRPDGEFDTEVAASNRRAVIVARSTSS